MGIPYDSSPNGAETTSADDPKLDDIDAVQMLVDDALDSSQRSNRRIASDERDLVEDRLESLPVYEGDDEYVRGTYVTRDSEAVALFLERED
ncbi:hypothetical protein RBH26_05505 [Natronolimnohabitans sp. A-GB9]|uniref:hypothetical protein n=1 Tax=Natronolimnohabitans sp. A-GB9 TaxID=3069757 RepID=UPI0027B09B20|nr:hypothetical protein [Natronolimnohabitans sp. A-GB9]MDQ2049935.1 hypothetical protein [Natronolimnohabitans sp. A-GB9]